MRSFGLATFRTDANLQQPLGPFYGNKQFFVFYSLIFLEKKRTFNANKRVSVGKTLSGGISNTFFFVEELRVGVG